MKSDRTEPNLTVTMSPLHLHDESLLSPSQIQTYLQDGILVVPLLSSEELLEAQRGLVTTLWKECGVDVHDLEGTGWKLTRASSTLGAGGVLDIFYPAWKMKIATNEKLFRMTCQLWKEAYCHNGESFEEMMSSSVNGRDDSFKWHPFGAFDCNKGYMYIDRLGYRIPTEIAERIGQEIGENKTQTRSKKPRPIQRSLTPHFDCCPETYHDAKSKNKWRPIQCFVSLTDNLHANTGGFEAVPGFHKEFLAWTKNGRQTTSLQQNEDGKDTLKSVDGQFPSTKPHPRPCVGEYTHLHPNHDRELLQRVQHIPVQAGSAVFWDNRIPHGNAYRNNPPKLSCSTISNVDDEETSKVLGSSGSRAVVYCSFLPDVHVNRSFVKSQLTDWKLKRAPKVGNRWIKHEESNEITGEVSNTTQIEANLTDLGRRLLGLDDW
eukprot:CCRYP_014949-RA/>CCRYP_014949-RA protein AED:0.08 eAED:0.08 QI:119/1/1/1/1/1/3/524/432